MAKKKKTKVSPLVQKLYLVKGFFSQSWLPMTIGVGMVAVIVGILFLQAQSHLTRVKAQKPLTFSQLYSEAMTQKKFGLLWDLYAPSYQQYINDTVGKAAYLAFLQKKFATVTIKKISLSECKNGKTIYPYGVESQYTTTCVSTVSMSATAPTDAQTAQLSAFSHLSLITTQVDGKTMIVGGGPTDLQAPVIFPSVIPHAISNVPIVMYHRIAPLPNRVDYESDYAYKLDVGLTVTPFNFTSQLDQLTRLGYHSVSPNDVFNHMYYNLPLPNKPILLTFDDGRLSDYVYGLPILLSHHMTATFMIPPYLTGKMFGYHNHNKYMSFSMLQTLAKDGMFVENHSLKHDKPIWDIPPLELEQQLILANSMIETYTQYPIQFIAYPGRWPYAKWQQTSKSILATEHVLSQMGFGLSFLDLGQNLILENSDNPYQIPRVRGADFPTVTSFL